MNLNNLLAMKVPPRDKESPSPPGQSGNEHSSTEQKTYDSTASYQQAGDGFLRPNHITDWEDGQDVYPPPAAAGTEKEDPLAYLTSVGMTLDDIHKYQDRYGFTLEEMAAAVRRAIANGEDPTRKDGEDPPAASENQQPIRPIIYTAESIMNMDFKPLNFLVEGLLPENSVGLFSSPPKAGKSWACLDLCLSLAMGRPFLGRSTRKARSLYISLEDGPRRLKARLDKLLDGNPCPSGVSFITEAPTMPGFKSFIYTALMETVPDLCIIDTFQLVRDPSGNYGKNAYEAEYQELRELKECFDKAGVSLILVHHLRKSNGEDNDPHNQISGSTAMQGAVDFLWTLQKTRNEDLATLYTTGRDILQEETVLQFNQDSCRWKTHGSLDDFQAHQLEAEYQESPIVKTVKRLLDEAQRREWRGTGAALKREADRFGLFIREDGRELGSKIKELEALFYDCDNIIHTRITNGTKSSLHSFRDASIPEATTLDELSEDSPTPWD